MMSLVLILNARHKVQKKIWSFFSFRKKKKKIPPPKKIQNVHTSGILHKSNLLLYRNQPIFRNILNDLPHIS